jgi:hypothetical protein
VHLWRQNTHTERGERGRARWCCNANCAGCIALLTRI